MTTELGRRPVRTATAAEVAATALSPRAALNAKWRALLDQITELSVRLHDNNEDGTSDHDDQRHAAGLRLQAAIDAVRRDMRNTEAALDRLTHRTYGSCEECGRPIDALRLIGLPAANLCRRCDRPKAETRP